MRAAKRVRIYGAGQHLHRHHDGLEPNGLLRVRRDDDTGLRSSSPATWLRHPDATGGRP